MDLVVVLGAGFSKAIHSHFPTADELGERVRIRLAAGDLLAAGAPPEFVGGGFERWLSRIAEAQPDLSDAQNMRNAALFQEATRVVQDELVRDERQAVSAPAPWWLVKLVGMLHVVRATAITFNYDTLVERAAMMINAHEVGGQAVSTASVLNGVPPEVPVRGPYGPTYLDTFRLLKLHGSLDTHWVRGDSSGATIARLPGPAVWSPDVGATANDGRLERLVPGRQPFIVPPASAKSGFFSNPITRQLWQTAALRLRKAERIVIMGYSLPLTDLVAVALLGEAQRDGRASVEVVNPDGAAVVERLVEAAWMDRSLVRVTASTVEEYVEVLERELACRETGQLRSLPADASVVVAGPGGGVARAVTGFMATAPDKTQQLGVGPTVSLDSLSFSSGALTIADVLSRLDASGTEALSVAFGTEMACIVSHVTRDPSVDRAELVVLVPSGTRAV